MATDGDRSDSLASSPRRGGPTVTERFNQRDTSSRYQLERTIGRLADETLTVIAAAAWLLPFVVLSVLTVDLPARLFDGWITAPALRPSLWLSRGDIFAWLGLVTAILVTRRFGGRIAALSLIVSWSVVFVLAVLMFLYLAPRLAPEDLPGWRFTAGFVGSWYAGAWIAINLYDLLRGGRWWRAPLLAAVFGSITQSVVSFPLLFAGKDLPWGYWLVVNILLQTTLALLFLLPYHGLRRRIRPRPGLGGK